MGYSLGSPATVTVSKARETFRLEIGITLDATGQNPTYVLRGHGQVVQRDNTGAEIMRNPTVHTVTIPDALIPAGLKTLFGNIVAKIDTLPSDDGQA